MKHFFRTAFLFAILFALSVCTAQDSYRVIFLGDTHYDAKDAKLHPEGISQARHRDTEMWKERLPRLLTAANKKAAESNTAFVLQGGDMVEGYGGTADAHKNMLEAGYKRLQGFFSIPVLTTAGNHDISSKVQAGETSPVQIYKNFATEYVIPAIKSIKGVSNILVSQKGTDIAFRYGKDLYFIMDFNYAGTKLAFVKKVLKENADARYKIILTHAGPISWDVGWAPNWRLYGNPTQQKTMEEILPVFQKHNCIFLTGHYHGIASLEYTTELGSIYQIQGCCVWTPGIQEKLNVVRDKVEQYGGFIMKSKHLKTDEEKQALINRFKPGLKSYFYAGGVGYMTLDISDSGVVINYFHRDSDKVSYTFTIPNK